MRIVVLLLIFCLGSCSEPTKRKDDGPAKDHEKKTEATFTDLQGNDLELEDLRGQPLLVNYWATWCVPCLKEFPSFVSLQDSVSEDGIRLLFASPDQPEKISAFKKSKGYDLAFLHLNPSLDKLEIYALPSTFIYDSEGKLYKRIDGAMDWNTPEVVRMLRQVP